MAEKPEALLSAEAIAAMAERPMQHILNANGVRMTRSLSDACGMKQLGVHLVRVEPGHESTEYHTHSHDEDWIYILSGRASAEVGGRKMEASEVRELVEGIPLSPFVHVATGADFASPFANAGDQGLGYINSDVTLYLHRLPVTRWIGLDDERRMNE